MTQKHLCGQCEEEFSSLKEYEEHDCKVLKIKPQERGK